MAAHQYRWGAVLLFLTRSRNMRTAGLFTQIIRAPVQHRRNVVAVPAKTDRLKPHMGTTRLDSGMPPIGYGK